MSTKKPIETYTREFRLDAVRHALSGKTSISKTADNLGVNKNTLHTWIGKYKDDDACG